MRAILHKVFVSALISRKDKYLTLQRSESTSFPNRYELPGGKIDLKESPLKAVVREVREETGLDLNGEIIRSIAEVHVFCTTQKNGVIYLIPQILFYVTLLKDHEVTIGHEHQSFKWVSAEELKQTDDPSWKLELVTNIQKAQSELVEEITAIAGSAEQLKLFCEHGQKHYRQEVFLHVEQTTKAIAELIPEEVLNGGPHSDAMSGSQDDVYDSPLNIRSKLLDRIGYHLVNIQTLDQLSLPNKITKLLRRLIVVGEKVAVIPVELKKGVKDELE